MHDDRRDSRRLEIETAAHELLAERGFAGTSMLSIARKARASNETLYAWYGDKLGLFRAMVERNADAAAARLDEAVQLDGDLADILQAFGTALLAAILSQRAISLNRVAAADLTGETGRIIQAGGRDRLSAALTRVFREHAAELHGAPPEDCTDLFLRLLIGDAQIRRVIGVMPAPSDADCADWARVATERLLAQLRQRRP